METVGDQAVAEGPTPPMGGNESPRAGRRFTRSNQDKILAGVIGGLANYFDIDPVILRVAFVVLTVVGFGAGLPLYLLAWLIIPEEGQQDSKASQMLRSDGWLRPVLAVGLLALGTVLLIVSFPFDGGLTALVLIGIGVVLLLSRKDGDPPSPRPQSAPGSSGEGEPAPLLEKTPRVPQPGSPETAPPRSGQIRGVPRPQERPPRPRSVLGPVTLSLLLILGGVAWLLDGAGALDVSPFGFLAFALAVVGTALVVGAWWGRARSLILLGVVLTMVITVSLMIPSILDVPLTGGVGQVYLHPTDPAGLEDAYRLLAGELILDLTGPSLPEGATFIAASVGVGRLVVIVPADASVTVQGRVGMGEMALFGETDEGARRRRRAVSAGSSDSDRSLELEVAVGTGLLEVRRASS